MDDGRSVGGMGMGVGFVWPSVGGPAGMADANGAADGIVVQQRLQVFQLALGAAALDVSVYQGSDTRRIIATVFQALEPLQQQVRRLPAADDADNPAHTVSVSSWSSWVRAAHGSRRPSPPVPSVQPVSWPAPRQPHRVR